MFLRNLDKLIPEHTALHSGVQQPWLSPSTSVLTSLVVLFASYSNSMFQWMLRNVKCNYFGMRIGL
jgi:hypothetical protein